MHAIQEFRETVYNYYHQHPRQHSMPWRLDYNPYYVLLSEMMLQQTQVSRVVDYFNTFISLWTTIEELAKAPWTEVLTNWQGLGYNRRAKFLHSCAKEIVTRYDGKIPENLVELQTLPGIGVYSSAAILTFAFNKPVVVVETNIRRAIIHWFFTEESNIEEQAIREKTAEVLDIQYPRIWYWALMDYGSSLKKHIDNPNKKSKIYRKQSKFEGSNRQVRGKIVQILVSKRGKQTKDDLINTIVTELYAQQEAITKNTFIEKIEYNIQELEKEGMLAREKDNYYIAE